mmetsp:Transcript_20646/g.59821  ORF Transcript_20646/g.59821 Transcript_20646/m.59821 type:complete len:324 (+) Transcript_20646:31-1002(+)
MSTTSAGTYVGSFSPRVGSRAEAHHVGVVERICDGVEGLAEVCQDADGRVGEAKEQFRDLRPEVVAEGLGGGLQAVRELGEELVDEGDGQPLKEVLRSVHGGEQDRKLVAGDGVGEAEHARYVDLDRAQHETEERLHARGGGIHLQRQGFPGRVEVRYLLREDILDHRLHLGGVFAGAVRHEACNPRLGGHGDLVEGAREDVQEAGRLRNHGVVAHSLNGVDDPLQHFLDRRRHQSSLLRLVQRRQPDEKLPDLLQRRQRLLRGRGRPELGPGLAEVLHEHRGVRQRRLLALSTDICHEAGKGNEGEEAGCPHLVVRWLAAFH